MCSIPCRICPRVNIHRRRADLWSERRAWPLRRRVMGVLAGYLFGAFLLVLTNRHETLTLLTLFALVAATLAVGWRSEAATPAVPVAEPSHF